MLLRWHQRESGGSLLQHPEVVFLDVEAFALSLAPILNHKTQQKDGRGAHIFGGRKLEQRWQLAGRELLVKQGILLTEFARFLWEKPDHLPKEIFDVLVKLGILLPLPRDEPGARDVYSVGGKRMPPSADGEEKFLVLMRLPLEAPPETMGRFEAFSQLQEKFWGGGGEVGVRLREHAPWSGGKACSVLPLDRERCSRHVLEERCLLQV